VKITDEDFIALWSKYGSAAAVSQISGVNIRAVHERRRRIEARYGTKLTCSDKRSPDILVTVPQNGVRTTVDLDKGVIIVGSDAHYWPGIVSTAHRAFVAITRELKPKMVVMNGDALDGATISRHDRIQWENRPSIKQELQAVSDRLGEVEDAAKRAKLQWTWGNHDMRFSTKLAGVAAQFEGVKGFCLPDHFPRWNFSTSVMVNGSCMIKHRWHNGIHATYNNALKSGASMVTGHLHALQTRPFTDYNGTRYAVDTGTLSAPDGDQFTYAEDSPANHRSGFVVLTFHNGRLLPPELVEVLDEGEGTVFFRGQIIKV